MDTFFLILGVAGSLGCILMFFMLEQEKIDPQGIPFYAVNGLGALFVLVSVAYKFDSGDMGAIIQESVWGVIGLMGVVKAVRRKKKQKEISS